MMLGLDAGAEDLGDQGDTWQVTTPPTDLAKVRTALEEAGVKVTDADLTMLPSATIALETEADARKVLRVVDALEDHDDVQAVYANFDIPDSVPARPDRRASGLTAYRRQSRRMLDPATYPLAFRTHVRARDRSGGVPLRLRLRGGRAGRPAPRVVAAGVLTTPPSDPLPDRLAALDLDLRALVAEFKPDAVAVERVFFQVNARTAMSVGQASGLALAAAAQAGCEVVQYTPNEVKQAVAGYGSAPKEQVQRMVQSLLGLAERPKPPDAADALALALCHLASAPLRARLVAGAEAR